MLEPQAIREVFDLTDPHCNIIFGMSLDEARERVADGDDLPLVLVPVSILLPAQFSAQLPQVPEADRRAHRVAVYFFG